MAKEKSAPRFQVGDRVHIRYSDWRGRIVEYRGPLGVGGAHVYRVRVPLKPKATYVELPEDHLVALPMPPKVEPSPSATTNNPCPRYRVGDRVQIRDSDWRGRIVEYRYPLRVGGAHVYRVRVPHKPKPIYIEIPEEDLLPIPTSPKGEPSPSAKGQKGRVRAKRKEE